MKLTDLQPVWLSPDVFMFKNPTGGDDWLTVKRVALTHNEQWELHEAIASDDIPRNKIVPCKSECCWKFTGNDFNTMSVTPSLDASASGNWHGFITNGEIK